MALRWVWKIPSLFVSFNVKMQIHTSSLSKLITCQPTLNVTDFWGHNLTFCLVTQINLACLTRLSSFFPMFPPPSCEVPKYTGYTPCYSIWFGFQCPFCGCKLTISGKYHNTESLQKPFSSQAKETWIQCFCSPCEILLFVLEVAVVLPWGLWQNTQCGFTFRQFVVTLHWCNMSLTATQEDWLFVPPFK